MLNRITINCINSKNSRDSKHRPSAHNRPVRRDAIWCVVNASTPISCFAILWRKFIDFTRDHREKTQLTTLPYFIFVGGNYVICARLSTSIDIVYDTAFIYFEIVTKKTATYISKTIDSDKSYRCKAIFIRLLTVTYS